MIVEAPPDSRTKPSRPWKEKRNRCFADRRCGFERRKHYSIDYFVDGGHENRSGGDRRSGVERRQFWARDGFACIARTP